MKDRYYLDKFKNILGDDYPLELIEVVSLEKNKSFKAGEDKAKQEFLFKINDLIKQKESTKFNAEELDDDDWGQQRLNHNLYLEADIIELEELIDSLKYGDFTK